MHGLARGRRLARAVERKRWHRGCIPWRLIEEPSARGENVLRGICFAFVSRFSIALVDIGGVLWQCQCHRSSRNNALRPWAWHVYFGDVAPQRPLGATTVVVPLLSCEQGLLWHQAFVQRGSGSTSTWSGPRCGTPASGTNITEQVKIGECQ